MRIFSRAAAGWRASGSLRPVPVDDGIDACLRLRQVPLAVGAGSRGAKARGPEERAALAQAAPLLLVHRDAGPGRTRGSRPRTGFSPDVSAWCHAFLLSNRVRLSFAGRPGLRLHARPGRVAA